MRAINKSPVLLILAFASAANLCSSQTPSNLRKPARVPQTYQDKECGVSFQYPSNKVVVRIPSAETDKDDDEPDICSLAVQDRNQATKGTRPLTAIHIVRGTLEKISGGEGIIPDPEHPGAWIFSNGDALGQGEDEQRRNWHGVHMSYPIRLFSEHGYEGIGDAEMLIACKGIERCVIFDTEDLGYPTFNLILKTLHFLSTRE